MLEAVHGVGGLLKQGWRPKRTIVFGSWDAEEEGLVGSTEWVEQHAQALEHAVAYFNVDVAVSGPEFSAAAVPSLQAVCARGDTGRAQPVGCDGVRPVEDRAQGGQPNRNSAAPAEGDVRSAIWAPGRTLRPSSSTWAFRRPISGQRGPMGFTTRSSTTTTGSSGTPTPFCLPGADGAGAGAGGAAHGRCGCAAYDYVTYALEMASFIGAAKRKAQVAGMSGLTLARGGGCGTSCGCAARA